jgi:hypothetical protein
MTAVSVASSSLAAHGVAFAPQIAQAAARHGLDPTLLAAVAAQETGGPGSNAGANIVGDGGHGHGVFQIDDRWHTFAKGAAAMDPAKNADYAASMISGLLAQYGGNIHKALSAYNAGSPNATGTTTRWQDGSVLGYADSVLRHYQQLDGTPTAQTQAGPSTRASAAPPDLDALLGDAFAEGPANLGSVNALSAYHARSFRDLDAGESPTQGDPFASIIFSDDN